jgi:hypothetical protein
MKIMESANIKHLQVNANHEGKVLHLPSSHMPCA